MSTVTAEWIGHGPVTNLLQMEHAGRGGRSRPRFRSGQREDHGAIVAHGGGHHDLDQGDSRDLVR